MVKRHVKWAIWWRRAGIGLRLFLLLVCAALFVLLLYWQQPQEDSEQVTSNLLIFLLVNLNIVIICILAFLVGRNVVKLIFDRKKNLLGSRLRVRLIFAFVGLALIPTVMLFLLASGLLNRAIEGWFSNQVQSSVAASVKVAKHHYDWLSQYARDISGLVGEQLESKSFKGGLSGKEVQDLLDQRRQQFDFYGFQILDSRSNLIASAQNVAASIEAFSEPAPDPEALAVALGGAQKVLFEERGASQFVRAYHPLVLAGQSYVLLATLRVNPELTHALANINDSYKEYEQLKFFKNPLRSSYFLLLAMVTLSILFAAIWIGFYMARELTGPIQRLVEGMGSLARGNYNVQVRSSGDDEIAFLVRSFNVMAADLRRARYQAEEHRLFIETILSNLAVGVLTLDSEGRVTSINSAAARLFAVNPTQSCDGKLLIELLGPQTYRQIQPLLDSLDNAEIAEGGQVPSAEQEICILSGGREIKVICTSGRITDRFGKATGTVLLFDDITELSKAQQMAAWREVARRVAHEIKNPLTPIQLSAQRLANLSQKGCPPEAILESTQTIVEQVASIKRLADEFSRFARMPTAEFNLVNLNDLISDTVLMFAENNSEVTFNFVADNTLPEIIIDPEQIRAVLVNLIDNAIEAFREISGNGGSAKRVVVKSNYSRKKKIASFEVADNGPGVKDLDKARIFEPYFTTKSGGTGLGLAIVTSAVADHQGSIRVYDNAPRGTKFVVDLPIMQRQITQRRFAPQETATTENERSHS